jgi:excisionase family DNA binding protein
MDKLGYSVVEAARLSGLSRSLIYSQLKEGTLVARKLGRRTIITHEELRRFINSLAPLRSS